MCRLNNLIVPSESVLLWLLTLKACTSLLLPPSHFGTNLSWTIKLHIWNALMHSQAYLDYAIAHSLPITVPGYDRYDCCCMCVQGEGGACSNCGVICTVTQVTAKGALCNSCYQHWRYVSYLVLDREEGFCDDFLLVSISGWFIWSVLSELYESCKIFDQVAKDSAWCNRSSWMKFWK